MSPPFAPLQFQISVDVSVEAPDTGITVGQFIAFMDNLTTVNESNVLTVNVDALQTWSVTFELTVLDVNATVAALLSSCVSEYPTCRVVSSRMLRRRALNVAGESGILVLERSLLSVNRSSELSAIPQLVAPNVTVLNSTFVRADATVSVTSSGGEAEANALSAGSLSEETIVSQALSVLGDQSGVTVVVQPSIFPPKPPPSPPPSPASPIVSPPPPPPLPYTANCQEAKASLEHNLCCRHPPSVTEASRKATCELAKLKYVTCRQECGQ